jgi:hypothetical protein
MKKICVVLLALCAVFNINSQQQTGDNMVFNPGAFKLVLNDNFKYGVGYEGLVQSKDMVQKIGKFSAGDKFTLEIEFTASRDLEQALEIGLSSRNTWTWERKDTWEGEISEMYSIENVKKNKPVTAKFDLEALHDSPRGDRAANTIVFFTDGAGIPRKAGSGVKKPVTLKFTKFVLTKTSGTFKEPRADTVTLEPNSYETYHEYFYLGDEWLPIGVDKVTKGNVFEIECTFTSDTDLSELRFIICDTSQTTSVSLDPNNPRSKNRYSYSTIKDLSKQIDIADIAAGTPVTKTMTITATAGASSNSPDANKLFIITNMGGGDDITLTFTAWKVTWKPK